MPMPSTLTVEHGRLAEARLGSVPWKKWGPYLSERQWGTVREDYSDSGDAWAYFPHDHARSRAYRWGEDGLAGISDEQQRLCFAVALWNGTDSILKERLFGLTNAEGNHGEDVKEYYFYLDSTPTHSYMRYLYKYPHAAFPYADLKEGNRRRTRHELEYELLDTGVFEGDRYFDVFVEYAKAGPTDILVQVDVVNRGPEAARACILPTLWFRNVWSTNGNAQRPLLRARDGDGAQRAVSCSHPELGEYVMLCDGDCRLLFTENETNTQRLLGTPNGTPYVKDGINDAVVHNRAGAVNPAEVGTKAAAYYDFVVPAGGTRSVRVRIANTPPASAFGREFDDLLRLRREEANRYYATVIPSTLGADAANVMRQALAGMLWSKQYYYYDVDAWLEERGSDPFSHKPLPSPRNEHWHHMLNAHIISMPDKWEYPWYAAWDLAFHVLPFAMIDEEFAKKQLSLMLHERYQHPSGQLPAYEWNFGDANPPVHAFATFYTYSMERARTGHGDIEWLERSFHKLALNFTWWVNRKDRHGHNAFEGGFLGLDNIGVFDRSAPLPTGGYLEQADGTAWMAFFCQNMVEIAAELAMHKPGYSDMCVKFVEHFLWIATAMMHAGDDIGMWDEDDGFFYDVMRMPDGHAIRLKVRSMVGLLPLCAATVFEGDALRRLPDVRERVTEFLKARPEMRAFIHDPLKYGCGRHLMQAVLNERNLRRILKIMLNEQEFLSPFGIRALSRYHAEHPYTFRQDGREYQVSYQPAESETSMFGGNSNWRGPVWMPLNILIIRALLQYFIYYGADFTIECPTGSGRQMNLYEVAEEITRRLRSIFERDAEGIRAVYGGTKLFQEDPHWRDLILFYEYFHGDNGAGLGAGHQTGWTGGIALLQHLFATSTPEQYLEMGKHAIVVEVGSDLPEAVQALRAERARAEDARAHPH